MGFRFRRSVSLGPLRITAGKKGLGVSVGVEGARVSLGADGKVRATATVPGTGLSIQETIGDIQPKKAHPGNRAQSAAVTKDSQRGELDLVSFRAVFGIEMENGQVTPGMAKYIDKPCLVTVKADGIMLEFENGDSSKLYHPLHSIQVLKTTDQKGCHLHLLFDGKYADGTYVLHVLPAVAERVIDAIKLVQNGGAIRYLNLADQEDNLRDIAVFHGTFLGEWEDDVPDHDPSRKNVSCNASIRGSEFFIEHAHGSNKLFYPMKEATLEKKLDRSKILFLSFDRYRLIITLDRDYTVSRYEFVVTQEVADDVVSCMERYKARMAG